jgi:hypothetical protein
MLGSALHVSGNSDFLAIWFPVSVSLLIGDVLLLLLFFSTYRMTRVPGERKKLFPIAILCLLAFVVLFTPAKITFDAKANRVSVSSLFLMIPQHRVVPFASVQGAKVSIGKLTSTLVLERTDGSTERITEFFPSVWMLDEAAMKINAFLRHYGRTGYPFEDL